MFFVNIAFYNIHENHTVVRFLFGITKLYAFSHKTAINCRQAANKELNYMIFTLFGFIDILVTLCR